MLTSRSLPRNYRPCITKELCSYQPAPEQGGSSTEGCGHDGNETGSSELLAKTCVCTLREAARIQVDDVGCHNPARSHITTWEVFVQVSNDQRSIDTGGCKADGRDADFLNVALNLAEQG